MKKITMLCVMIVVFAGCFITSSAAAKIKETPTVKIIVDGVQMEPKSTPISIDGQTLVGFKDILVALGVPNDVEHIVWDPLTKTIKAIKDNNEVELTVGQKKAVVDGSKVELEVAPVEYKKNTYIPVRFIAESLKKKVFWDSYTQSLSICEEEMYKKINSLPKSTSKPQRFQHFSVLEYFERGDDRVYTHQTESKRDVEKNIEYSIFKNNIDGHDKMTEYFENDTYIYSRREYQGEWKRVKKAEVKNDTDNVLAYNADTRKAMVSNLIYEELIGGRYALEGDSIYFALSMTKGSSLDVLKDKTSKCHVTMLFDAATNEMTSFRIEITGTEKTSTGNTKYSLYRDLYKQEEIKSVPIPKDLKNFYTLPKGYQDYFSTLVGVYMIVPDSWIIPEDPYSDPTVLYVDPKNENNWCGVYVEKLSSGSIFFEFNKNEVVKSIKSSFLNSKLLKEEKVKWKNCDAVKVII